MKNRIVSIGLILFISFISLGILTSSAQAADKTILLIEPAHRDLLGVSLDNELTTLLLPTGRLGALIYLPVAQPRTWLIDAALIDDVSALAVKDPVAQEWLTELKAISVDDPVVALPYGHPYIPLAKRLAPTELEYYYQTSRTRLQTVLGREVVINSAVKWTGNVTKVPAETVRSYTLNRRAIVLLSTVVPAEQLDALRANLALLLSTGSTKSRQLAFARNADAAITLENHKLRIVTGKYRLTSQHEKVPITLVNDFGAPVTLSLRMTPLNSRIQVDSPGSVTLPANSKTQIAVPFTVIAPGSTAVLAQFRNSKGSTIGNSAILTLSLSVISPTVAWFTTGAAILLFLAALTQSVRRVRRSRK